MEFTKKFLEPVSEFNEIAEYEGIIQKAVVILYTWTVGDQNFKNKTIYNNIKKWNT